MIESLRWNIISSEEYNALTVKDSRILYLLSNIGKIYKGDIDISTISVLVDSLPKNNYSLGTLYLIKGTLEGFKYDNKWVRVVGPVVENVLSDDKKYNLAITGEAIKTYVKNTITTSIDDDFVESISYNDISKCIEYKLGDKTLAVALSNLLYNVDYIASENKLLFHFNKVKDVEVPLSTNNNIKSSSFDPISKQLILKLNNDKEVVLNLLSTLNFDDIISSNKIDINNDSNKLSLNTKISKEANNALNINDKGLEAVLQDVNNKADKLPKGIVNEIVISKSDGNISHSGIKIGSGMIESGDDKTIITELAFRVLYDYIQNKIDSTVISKMTSLNMDTITPSTKKILTEEGLVNTFTFGTF